MYADARPQGDMAPLDESRGPAVLSTQRVRTLNVGRAGLRESLPHIVGLFADLPAVVFIQEARLPLRAVRDLKKQAHRLLPHYSLFVGALPAPDSSNASRRRAQVVTFVHCQLAARASLLEVTRQLGDSSAASRQIGRAHV